MAQRNPANKSLRTTNLLPLSVRSVNFHINGKPLISNVSFELSENNITVVMGHNGAGKSLLARLLHGILEPQSGSIKWNGHNAVESATRTQQSMVFQKPVLLRRSVKANLDYVLQLRGRSNPQRRTELLIAAQLADKETQAARSLSGGEQQRLAIARALATDPEVLLLDEPTASLDPAATEKIETLISTASQSGVKIIMVTHDIAQAKRLANDVLLLDGGTVAEHTAAKLFFKQPQSSAGHYYLSGYLQHLHQTPFL